MRRRGMFWFIAGGVFGACAGVIVAALCAAGARADECRECKSRGAEWEVGS